MNIEIDMAQQPEAADVQRCLRTLYGTTAGTLALDRDFGLSQELLDLPLPAAQAAATAEIIEKTMRYEPRARVIDVAWTARPEDGALTAKVRCELVKQ